MAVIRADKRWPGRVASDDITKRTQFTDIYEVETDDLDDDQTVAGGSSLLPRLGDAHDNYPDAFVVRVDPEQLEDSPFLWHVHISYDTELPATAGGSSGAGSTVGGVGGPAAESQKHDSGGGSGNNPDPMIRDPLPTQRNAAWTVTTVEEEEPLDIDADGNPVLNSAGYPYDPPLMTVVRRKVIGLNKNVAGIDLDEIDDWIDHVNATTWRGHPAGTVRIIAFNKQSAYDKIAYTEVFVQFKVKRKKVKLADGSVIEGGWRRFPIDRGYYEVIDTFGSFEAKRIVDKFGVPLPQPSLLDGAARKLEDGEEARIFPEDGIPEFPEAEFADLLVRLGVP